MYTYRYIYAYIHINVYSYIHTYIHTYIQKYKNTVEADDICESITVADFLQKVDCVLVLEGNFQVCRYPIAYLHLTYKEIS